MKCASPLARMWRGGAASYVSLSLLWRLAPGEVHESEPHTSGTRKLLLVLEGTIELKAGQDTQRLAAGDSASFRSDVADSYGNPASPGPHAPAARFALAVFEPQVELGDKS